MPEDIQIQNMPVLARDCIQSSHECASIEHFESLKEVDPRTYDRIVVFFSGGKDSLACLLWLLEIGVPTERIELHHHLVDGRESDLMDWPITESYCEAVAKAFGLKINFSWKSGGFEREMNRDNQPTAETMVPVNGTMIAIGGKGKVGTRLKFPQVSTSLSVRWCSAYLKIDCGAAYIVNNPVFRSGKTLVVTGERAQESAARAKYNTFEPHRTDNRNGVRVRRIIDHWRPIHQWSEEKVWDLIEKYKVRPHPAYILGFGRTSCIRCIFGSPDQWASVKELDEPGFKKIVIYERKFGLTIHRTRSVEQQAALGTPYQMNEADKRLAMSKTYDQPIFVDDWVLPAGAYGDSCGPS